MKISVREIREEDIDRILEIETDAFATPWSRESLLFEIRENILAKYIVGEIDGYLVGYGGLWTVVDEGHITNIAVESKFRKNGVGEMILRELIKESLELGLAAMTLEVRVSNEAAIKLYEKMGFKSVGIRPKYYSDNNEDAIIMWKRFEER